MRWCSFLSSLLLCTTTRVRTLRQLQHRTFQAEKNHTDQIDSLKMEINEKLFAKANSLIDKFSSCPRIKLPNSKSLMLDRMETGVLLSDLAQELRGKYANVLDIHFTHLALLIYLQLWFRIKMPKPKRER